MKSITTELVEGSLNINKLAISVGRKLSTSLTSKSLRWELSGELHKLIALIQASSSFNIRASSSYETTKDIGVLRKLIKKDINKIRSLTLIDLGFLVARLENLAVLLNR